LYQALNATDNLFIAQQIMLFNLMIIMKAEERCGKELRQCLALLFLKKKNYFYFYFKLIYFLCF
jgi:hypothetical protein